jgi:hypothetical protein
MAYADDLLIVVSGSDHQTAQEALQTKLNEIEEKAHERGLLFSPEKSTVVDFSKRRTKKLELLLGARV